MTHSITLSARVDRPHIPASGGIVHVLMQLHAPRQESGQSRLPVNLAAVVDRSGSMAGPKLEYAKQALTFLVDQLAGEDRLAIVTYDDQVDTLLPSQQIVHKDPLKARLSRIESGGSTNLSGGLATGMQLITPHAGPGCVSRTVLMTDGLANVGVTDPATLVSWVRQWREKGLALSTIGVGDDFNEDLLVAMAEAGGSGFHYIANPDEIPAIFADELQGLLQVAAQGLQLQVSAPTGVAIEAVVGYPPTGTPSALSLTLPDLYSGETKSVLLRLAVAAPPADGKLVTLTLNYLPATADAVPQSVTVTAESSATDDEALLAAPPDMEVSRQIRLADATVAREEAVRLADEGNLEAGAERLSLAAEALACMPADEYANEQAEALRAQAEALRHAQYDRATRKEMRHQAFLNRQGQPPRRAGEK